MSTQPEARRYATCLRCSHAITMFENNALRFAVDCPRCKKEKAFGPGVFIESFAGVDEAEVWRRKKARAAIAKAEEVKP